MKSANISIRCEPERKRRLQKLAREAGLPLGEYLLQAGESDAAAIIDAVQPVVNGS